ncbi:hypothetical protein B0H12DRAFT_1076364 [Mycena haematopus]|nr:hypothetical protein B0H12DRAFT_1076364 [Mycena haematopus]
MPQNRSQTNASSFCTLTHAPECREEFLGVKVNLGPKQASSTVLAVKKRNELPFGTKQTGDQRAELQRLGVWLIVKGTIVAPTSTDSEELCKWLVDSDKAAGSIYASIDTSQRVHVKGMEENPVAMWAALERVHKQKKPGARFAAYNHLFSIQQLPDETLTKLMGRVDEAVSLIKDLRPPAHTLDDLDGELASMAMIRALPEEFKAFRSSLFLLPQLARGSNDKRNDSLSSVELARQSAKPAD